MATEAERAWMDRSDDIFDVVADIDPPSRRLRYAFEAGYHAAGTEPDDVGHVCANDPLHAQAKIISQRQEIGRLREAARSILWMAREYAVGGGRGGPEMQDYEAAAEIIGED